MATGRSGFILRHIRTAVAAPATRTLSDWELLHRFAAQADEEAFATLVRRHGPLVLAACRRVLGNWHDAEDAFQATFLVLARKAGRRAWQESVGNWLYQVAYRLALNAKEDAARRACRERRVAERPAVDSLAEVTGRELGAVLDEELNRLPERYRVAVVLCCLEGSARDEAARQLGWSLGTLKRRLERARVLLRQRLERRGFTFPAASTPLPVAGEAARAGLPFGLLESALQAGARPAVVSARVHALAGGVLRPMLLGKLKAVTALLLLAGVAAAGAFGYRLAAGGDEPEERSSAATPPAAASRQPNTDGYGDLLPAGVLARLGSARLRHGDTVKDLAFLPDGNTLVAADELSIRLWDAATGRELRRFGDGHVQSISVSANGKRLASSPVASGPYRVWDLATGRLVRTIDGPEWSSVVLSPDGNLLASVGANAGRSGLDSVVHLWDVNTGREIHLLNKHTDIVWSLAFSPDGERLYSGGADKTIRIWDIAGGREVGRIEGCPNPVCLLAMSPDGKWLASVGMHYDKYSADKLHWSTFPRVHLWDTATRKEVRQIVAPDVAIDQRGFPADGFHALAFTPDSKTLVTTGVRNIVRLWDVATGKQRRQIKLPGTMAYTVAVSPDGRTLAAGDNVLHLWDIATSRELLPQAGHQSALTAVAVSPDGRTIATGGRDRTVRLWDRATGRETRRFDTVGPVCYVGFAGGGRELVACAAKLNCVWDIATGRELRRFPGVEPDFQLHWALSSDGKTLAQALDEKAVSLWDPATGRRLRQVPEAGTQGLGFSPDGRTLLVCNGLNNVHLYEAATGKHLHGFPTMKRDQFYAYNNITFSPDGRWVTLWSFRYQQPTYHVRVHLYDTATGKEVRYFEDLGRPVGFSPDSRLLACRSTDDDRQVHLVEVASGKEVRRLIGHEGTVRALARAADGRTLVTAAADATALVWDVTGLAGKEVRLSPRAWEQRWTELADSDPGRAYRAGWMLTASPQGVQFLQERLRPAVAVAPEQVARLIKELDDDRFAVRSAATAALEDLGARAEKPLRQALADKPSVEARRRMQALLENLEQHVLSPGQVRSLRAVAVLEAAGTSEARRLLANLAGGAPEALRTQEAKAAIERLAARP
jgi:RNA polymerase sigma factor (sigma-70 family)